LHRCKRNKKKGKCKGEPLSKNHAYDITNAFLAASPPPALSPDEKSSDSGESISPSSDKEIFEAVIPRRNRHQSSPHDEACSSDEEGCHLHIVSRCSGWNCGNYGNKRGHSLRQKAWREGRDEYDYPIHGHPSRSAGPSNLRRHCSHLLFPKSQSTHDEDKPLQLAKECTTNSRIAVYDTFSPPPLCLPPAAHPPPPYIPQTAHREPSSTFDLPPPLPPPAVSSQLAQEEAQTPALTPAPAPAPVPQNAAAAQTLGTIDGLPPQGNFTPPPAEGFPFILDINRISWAEGLDPAVAARSSNRSHGGPTRGTSKSKEKSRGVGKMKGIHSCAPN
jgi:hypothetical protein